MRYICTSIVAVLMLAGTSFAQDAVEWRVEDGGNGHWYAVALTSDNITWTDASSESQANGGHLASLTSSDENDWVHELTRNEIPDWTAYGPWIGGFQDLDSPDYSEPGGAWTWVTGEAWGFTAWNTIEPNDANGGTEHWLQMTANPLNTTWNDAPDDFPDSVFSYVIEWSADCNGDGIVDYGQILDGTFEDLDEDGIPDSCQLGPCCHEGTCDELSLPDCTLLGGLFFGESTTCDQVSCDGTWVVAQDGSGNFDSVQEAIVAADDGDVVLVMPGHYFENITFLGKAITVQSSVPTSPELTIIDGGGTFDNTVVFAAAEDGDSVLDGFFITGGNSPLNGGGIYCISSPTIRNCIISGNHADENGGGLYITGNPTFDTCIIHGNDADGLGNGMYISSSTANIIDCMFGASSSGIGEAVYAHGSGANFTGTTIDGQGVSGIGARLDFCSTTWTNCNIRNCNNTGMIITNSIADQFLGCTFSNNAANYGGGIYCEGGVTGAPILAGCIFNNNTASQDGGGIYCTAGSSPAITGCTITSNSAAWGGGIGFRSSSNPTISGCIISGNTAAGIGGGIYCDESSLTLTDCTFTGNTAIDGGGMQSINSMLTLTGCTFINNIVTSEGGGMVAKGSNSGSTLTGCTFENNTANSGGGMCNYMNSNITLTNCIFTNNTATHGGGMSNNNGSSPTVENCSFTGNTATANGGGIHCLGSTPTITDCTISGNTATDGGGIYCSWSSATISGCTITNNTTSDDGGGIWCDESSPTISGCEISDNTTSGAYAGGGGIFCVNNSSPTLTDCTILGNTATYDGGGIRCYYSSNPTISGCTISGNTASDGGGISCYESSNPTLTDCTISGNTAASHGGGIFVWDSTPALTNCPISYNTAGGDGGGIHNSDGGSPVLVNCEFTGNQGVLGGGMYNGNDSSQEVANLTFTENTATRGGGIYVADTNINSMIDSCTFVGNIATSDGGGLFSSAASCEVADSIFESNAAAQGAGLYLEEGSILRSELRGNIASAAGGGLYSASPTGIYLQDSLICENEPDWIEGEWIDGTGNDFPVNCPTDCPGDYDSDGNVNVVDILGVIGDWGPCNPDAPCPSDFNGDGVVGVNDVLIVISAWGPCE